MHRALHASKGTSCFSGRCIESEKKISASLRSVVDELFQWDQVCSDKSLVLCAVCFHAITAGFLRGCGFHTLKIEGLALKELLLALWDQMPETK